jgi:hypothetical protein
MIENFKLRVFRVVADTLNFLFSEFAKQLMQGWRRGDPKLFG